MKKLPQILFFLLLLTCSTARALTPEDLQELKQRSSVMNRAGKSDLAVTFRHADHEDVRCSTCHHIRQYDGRRYVSCSADDACHDAIGLSNRTSAHSYFSAIHNKMTSRSCLGCHRRAAATKEKGCRSCHKRQRQKQQD